jgi:DNA-binding NarL/FixJ family response regulator
MLDNAQCAATNVVDLSDFTPALHKIRIFLVGQQELFVDALRALIEEDPGFAVAGIAHQLSPEKLAETRVDVVLVDVTSGEAEDLQFLPGLIEAASGARILILTDNSDSETHLHAVRLGAMGGISRAEKSNVLFKAIRAVYSGEIWLDRSLLRAALQGKTVAPQEKSPRRNQSETSRRIGDVTARERDVIALICEGRKNREIADCLLISECTVRHHLTSIFDKLGVENRLELLLFAQEHQLIKPTTFSGRDDRRGGSGQRRSSSASVSRVSEPLGAVGTASSE